MTVRFEKPTPEFLFLSLLAGQGGGVLPKHIYGKGDIITNPANNSVVGTGPMEVQELGAGEQYRV